MPLSEHEQRLLDEIEQGLLAEDPKFVSHVRSARSHHPRRAIVLCVLGVLLGLGLVLVGLLTKIVVVSVLGFVLIVAACGYAVQSRHASSPRSSSSEESEPRASNRPQRQSGLRSRMEDRLRKRFDES